MSSIEPDPAHGAPRQFVNFAFFRLDPAVRRLGSEQKLAIRTGFLELFAAPATDLLCHSYSTSGLRADADFLLWRIASSPAAIQAHARAVNLSLLGGYLAASHSFLSVTRRSVYVDKLDPGHTESRARIVPGQRRYLFVYPFVKSRQWYRLPLERRQAMMDEHIRVGNKYPSVKLNTTYSFGLDDQDFVVAFETDRPEDFVDLVMELRQTEASRYTVRDTPIFTCVQTPIAEILAQLF